MKIYASIITLVFLSLGFQNCGSSPEDEPKPGDCLTECSDCKGKGITFPKEDIARFIISSAFFKSPQIVKSRKITDYVYSVNYINKQDNKKHEYHVKFQWKGESCSRTNRAYWASVEDGRRGRWRDTQYDEAIEFKQENDKLLVRVVYSDGSEETDYYGRND